MSPVDPKRPDESLRIIVRALGVKCAYDHNCLNPSTAHRLYCDFCPFRAKEEVTA